MHEADFLIAEFGNGTALTPLSAKAREACRDRIVVKSWQWMFGSVMVEDRIASDLVASLQADGFRFARETN
jgi:hypothetical protein